MMSSEPPRESAASAAAAKRRLGVLSGHLRKGAVDLKAAECAAADPRRSAPSSGEQRAFPVRRYATCAKI